MSQSRQMTIYANRQGYTTMRMAGDVMPVRAGFMPIVRVSVPRRVKMTPGLFYRRVLGDVVSAFGL